MLDNIINKNIVFLQNHGVKINSEDDKTIYKYGLQILYYYIIDLAVIFSLAAIFGKLYETSIMTFIFALFQVFGGGYHAKTPTKCLLTMITGVTIGNVYIVLFTDKFIFNMISAIVLTCFILFSAPVVNKNRRPVSKKVKNRSKIMIRAILMIILMMIFISSIFNRYIELSAIVVTLYLYYISWISGKLKNLN